MSRFFYGVDGKEKEVTDIVLSLISSEKEIFPFSYNSLFGDPCSGRKKRLRVSRSGRNYYFPENSSLDLDFLLNDYKNFDWITYVLNYPDLSFIKNEVDALAHLEGFGKREGRLLTPLWGRNGEIYLSVKENRLALLSLFYSLFLGYYLGKEVVIKRDDFPTLDIPALQEILDKEKMGVGLLLREELNEDLEEFNLNHEKTNLIDLLLSLRLQPSRIFISNPLLFSQHASFLSLEEKVYSLLAKFISSLPSFEYVVFSKENVEGEVLSLYFSFLRANEKECREEEDFLTLSRVKKFFGMESSLFNRTLANLRKVLGKPSYLLTEKLNSYFLEKI